MFDNLKTVARLSVNRYALITLNDETILATSDLESVTGWTIRQRFDFRQLVDRRSAFGDYIVFLTRQFDHSFHTRWNDDFVEPVNPFGVELWLLDCQNEITQPRAWNFRRKIVSG